MKHSAHAGAGACDRLCPSIRAFAHGGAGPVTGQLCDVEPPLINTANVGYGLTAGIDDLASVTSLPLPVSPYRGGAVTWSPRHVIDDFRADLADGHYATKLGTAQTLCLRRHREVYAQFDSRTKGHPGQSCPWVGLTHGLGWVGLGPLQQKY